MGSFDDVWQVKTKGPSVLLNVGDHVLPRDLYEALLEVARIGKRYKDCCEEADEYMNHAHPFKGDMYGLLVEKIQKQHERFMNTLSRLAAHGSIPERSE